jgi:putative membrane protein
VRWLPLPTLLVALHLLGNVLWIGALLSVVTVVGRARWMADPSEIGALARRIHMRVAVPGFLLSLAAGIGRLLLDPEALLRLPWMHVKLTLAVGIIVIHHVIGSRVRRVAEGARRSAPGVGVLGALVLLCAAGAVLLGVAKTLPR